MMSEFINTCSLDLYIYIYLYIYNNNNNNQINESTTIRRQMTVPKRLITAFGNQFFRKEGVIDGDSFTWPFCAGIATAYRDHHEKGGDCFDWSLCAGIAANRDEKSRKTTSASYWPLCFRPSSKLSA